MRINSEGDSRAADSQQLADAQAKKQLLERMMLYIAEQNGDLEIDWEDIYYEEDGQQDPDVIQLNELAEAPSKLDEAKRDTNPNVI